MADNKILTAIRSAVDDLATVEAATMKQTSDNTASVVGYSRMSIDGDLVSFLARGTDEVVLHLQTLNEACKARGIMLNLITGIIKNS